MNGTARQVLIRAQLDPVHTPAGTAAQERETHVITFDGFKVVFGEKILALQAQAADSPGYRALEQQLGLYCYKAEEQLPATELRLLKGTLGISVSKWQRYKASFIAGRSSL